MSATPDPTQLSLPRILCLHGGGVNAEIFALQARTIIKELSGSFRLVFADGPHFCEAGPGIATVYGAHGPFRRWLRWIPGEHGPLDNAAAAEEVLYAIRSALREDAGTGPVVGLLGFSQGAKLAASLLYDSQCRRARGVHDEFEWKFAVMMHGRHPLVSLSKWTAHPALVNAGDISEGFDYRGVLDEKLRLPTIHIHGLNDEGLHLHRRMLHQYCDTKTATVIEWDGDHRVPVKKKDVIRVCDSILVVARSQGIKC